MGKRLEEWGLWELLQPGLTRASLHDYRLGHLLDALFAATLNRVLSALALQALEVYAIPTPWLPQDTTTMTMYGASEDAPKTPGAPHPVYGHSTDGRDDLKQVLLSLGVSGEAASPCTSGGEMATAVIVGQLPWQLQRVWRWAGKGCVGLWWIGRPRVTIPWACVSITRSLS